MTVDTQPQTTRESREGLSSDERDAHFHHGQRPRRSQGRQPATRRLTQADFLWQLNGANAPPEVRDRAQSRLRGYPPVPAISIANVTVAEGVRTKQWTSRLASMNPTSPSGGLRYSRRQPRRKRLPSHERHAHLNSGETSRPSPSLSTRPLVEFDEPYRQITTPPNP